MVEDRKDRAAAPADRRERSGRLAPPEFPVRQREFEALLAQLEDALGRSGLTLGRQHPSSSEVGASVGALPQVDEQLVWEQRAQVREVAAAMFSQVGRRLARLSRTFGRLSEEERRSLAALMRLPESRRGVIAAMLRLPEHERKDLSIGFRLSETECRALADLLDSNSASSQAQPKIRIVDAAIAAEDGAPPPDEER